MIRKKSGKSGNLTPCWQWTPCDSLRPIGEFWVAGKLTRNKDMVIRSFKKCGITTNVDGTENHEVNIRGVDWYIMPLPEAEFHLETSGDNDDETDSDTEDENGEYEMEEHCDISEHSSN